MGDMFINQYATSPSTIKIGISWILPGVFSWDNGEKTVVDPTLQWKIHCKLRSSLRSSDIIELKG
jgi:hypothetical protein